jgi:hypothetical protein
MQSFMWSHRLGQMDEGQRSEVESVANAALQAISPNPSVKVRRALSSILHTAYNGEGRGGVKQV